MEGIQVNVVREYGYISDWMTSVQRETYVHTQEYVWEDMHIYIGIHCLRKALPP